MFNLRIAVKYFLLSKIIYKLNVSDTKPSKSDLKLEKLDLVDKPEYIDSVRETYYLERQSSI